MTLPLPQVSADETVQFAIDKIAQQFPLTAANVANSLRELIWTAPGDMKMTAAATPPPGWILADGTSYLRSDYPDLYAAIGTTYGAVDGTHFTVPDMRGRMPTGVGTHADVNALGDSDGLAVAARTPAHTHGHAHDHTHDHRHDVSGTTAAPPAFTGTTVDAGVGAVVASETHTHSFTTLSGNPVDPAGFGTVPTTSTQTSSTANTDAKSVPYLSINFVIKT